MQNLDIEAARKYHVRTKHSFEKLQRSRHSLDWDNEPLPYKIYPDLEPIPLPTDLQNSEMPALSVLSDLDKELGHEAAPTLKEIAHLLYYTAGITKKRTHPNGEMYFRAAASAGALYPIEIYLVCGNLQDLQAGVYHFSPADFSLRQLRQGDFREVLLAAAAGESDIVLAPLTLVFTAITWRSAWKYQARSYRYHFWDCGVMAAHALASTVSQNLPAKVIMGFVDSSINSLLGLDGSSEKSLCLFPVGRDINNRALASDSTHSLPLLPEINVLPVPLSNEQVEYPEIDQLHKDSMLNSAEEVSAWQKKRLKWTHPEAKDSDVPLKRLLLSELPRRPVEEVIVRRGSSRSFSHESLDFSEFSTILSLAMKPFRADFLNGDLLNEAYLTVHAVQGLEAGAYYYNRRDQSLESLKRGSFRGEAAALCLGQDLGGDSSATIFFLADLEAILETYGNRGYRLAQMEAGVIGGKLYLASYALGRGATGLTFFDDQVVNFFSPHAAGLEAIFVVALGVPKKNSQANRRIEFVLPGEQVIRSR
jgi:SagB-type dehydrogenase family enzyme